MALSNASNTTVWQQIEVQKAMCHVVVAVLQVQFEGPLIVRQALKDIDLPNFSAPFRADEVDRTDDRLNELRARHDDDK
jgi:hypothetical protein